MKAKILSHKAGRPRTFDVAEALERATLLFWQKGYEGTSLSDLTEAMGINRPSMYAAFGNKESLFKKAVAHYIEQATAGFQAAMDRPTAREAAEAFLMGSLCDQKPRGCMLVQSALACSAESEKIKKLVASKRGDVEIALRTRFQKAIDENDLPSTTDAAALAKFMVTVAHGMSVQSSGGARREDLLAVVQQAMQAFPPSGK